MIIPLFFLAIGAIFAGYLFKNLFLILDINNFWNNSIFFLNPLSSSHPPTWFILMTPVLVVITIPLAYYIFVNKKDFCYWIVETNKPLYNFLKNKWYFDELYELIFINTSKKLGIIFWKIIDGSIIDRFGPDGISKFIKNLSNKAVKFQSGFIYQYAFIMLLGFSIILTILIIN